MHNKKNWKKLQRQNQTTICHFFALLKKITLTKLSDTFLSPEPNEQAYDRNELMFKSWFIYFNFQVFWGDNTFYFNLIKTCRFEL